MDCVIAPFPRSDRGASDRVSVRRLARVFHASFRHHLTMMPVCFASLHLHQVGRGTYTLLVYEHARHTSTTTRRAGGLMKAPRGGQRRGVRAQDPANPLLPLLRHKNVALAMLPLQRPSRPGRCVWEPSAVCKRSYIESMFLLDTLCALATAEPLRSSTARGGGLPIGVRKLLYHLLTPPISRSDDRSRLDGQGCPLHP